MQKNDIAIISKYLNEGRDVNICDYNGKSGLILGKKRKN